MAFAVGRQADSQGLANSMFLSQRQQVPLLIHAHPGSTPKIDAAFIAQLSVSTTLAGTRRPRAWTHTLESFVAHLPSPSRVGTPSRDPLHCPTSHHLSSNDSSAGAEVRAALADSSVLEGLCILPEDVASAMLFLASDLGRCINVSSTACPCNDCVAFQPCGPIATTGAIRQKRGVAMGLLLFFST